MCIMEYNKLIAQLEIGDEVEGFYILKTAQARVSNSGKPFLSAVLADRSGAIEAKVWDYSGPVGQSDEGDVLKIRGTVNEFRGAPQLIISRLRLTQEGDRFNLGDLVPVAPIDTNAAMEELRSVVESIRSEEHTSELQSLAHIAYCVVWV